MSRSKIDFARVEPSAAFSSSRSDQPISATARDASNSASRVGSRVAPRNALKKSSSVACIGDGGPAAGRSGGGLRHFCSSVVNCRKRSRCPPRTSGCTFSVSRTSSGRAVGVQQQQRARPVDRLADRRRLRRSSVAQLWMKATSCARSCRRSRARARCDDALLELRVRERDVQVQAAALQRVADLARVVAGEDHDRRCPAP